MEKDIEECGKIIVPKPSNGHYLNANIPVSPIEHQIEVSEDNEVVDEIIG